MVANIDETIMMIINKIVRRRSRRQQCEGTCNNERNMIIKKKITNRPLRGWQWWKIYSNKMIMTTKNKITNKIIDILSRGQQWQWLVEMKWTWKLRTRLPKKQSERWQWWGVCNNEMNMMTKNKITIKLRVWQWQYTCSNELNTTTKNKIIRKS
jgi:hypothetical protein